MAEHLAFTSKEGMTVEFNSDLVLPCESKPLLVLTLLKHEMIGKEKENVMKKCYFFTINIVQYRIEVYWVESSFLLFFCIACLGFFLLFFKK